MRRPRCPGCGERYARRCERVGAVERLLSRLDVYPFRCQLCGRRFRAFQSGVHYARRPLDRREYARLEVRWPASFTGAAEGRGAATEVSVEGCTVATTAPPARGGVVRLELEVSPDEPSLVVEEAVVRSVRAGVVGFQFVGIRRAEHERLRRLVAGLLGPAYGAPAPPPVRRRPLRHLRSADFWLAALIVVLVVVGIVTLFPGISFCTWGANC